MFEYDDKIMVALEDIITSNRIINKDEIVWIVGMTDDGSVEAEMVAYPNLGIVYNGNLQTEINLKDLSSFKVVEKIELKKAILKLMVKNLEDYKIKNGL